MHALRLWLAWEIIIEQCYIWNAPHYTAVTFQSMRSWLKGYSKFQIRTVVFSGLIPSNSQQTLHVYVFCADFIPKISPYLYVVIEVRVLNHQVAGNDRQRELDLDLCLTCRQHDLLGLVPESWFVLELHHGLDGAVVVVDVDRTHLQWKVGNRGTWALRLIQLQIVQGHVPIKQVSHQLIFFSTETDLYYFCLTETFFPNNWI